MTRLILISALSLSSVSCSTSVVHLYTLGLNDSEAQQLAKVIQAEGFRVRQNTLAVPRQIEKPTLVYSAFRQDLSDIDRLEAALSNAGYKIALEREAAANHVYTRNNIGLFPLAFNSTGTNDENNPDSADDLADTRVLSGREFKATCPDADTDAYLLLGPNHRFSLDYYSWDENNVEQRDGRRTGTWELNGQVLQLSSGSESAPFILETGLDKHPDNRRPEGYIMLAVIKLNNLLKTTGVFRGCDFSHVGSLE